MLGAVGLVELADGDVVRLIAGADVVLQMSGLDMTDEMGSTETA